MAVSEHLRRNAANLEAVGDELLDYVEALETANNELAANFNLLLAKLDADAGVTDEDYESTLEVGADEE